MNMSFYSQSNEADWSRATSRRSPPHCRRTPMFRLDEYPRQSNAGGAARHGWWGQSTPKSRIRFVSVASATPRGMPCDQTLVSHGQWPAARASTAEGRLQAAIAWVIGNDKHVLYGQVAVGFHDHDWGRRAHLGVLLLRLRDACMLGAGSDNGMAAIVFSAQSIAIFL
jgi:hypothetical protein